MRYTALLRGVNVGGNKRLDMKELRAAFEQAGMTSVRTYINSGNVIFSSEVAAAGSAAHLEDAIEKRFGFGVDLLVLDVDGMRTIVHAMPPDWKNDQAMKCDVLFLWRDVDSPAVLDGIDFDPQMEDVRYVPGAIIRRVDRKDAGRSALLKLVGTPLYRRLTIRNCNSARKLLELMEE
jgi:uncharacterized protein (DUF1697 family)